MKFILTFTLLFTVLFSKEIKITDEFVRVWATEVAEGLPIKLNRYSTIVSLGKVNKSILFNYVTNVKGLNQKAIDQRKKIYDAEWCNEDILAAILKAGYEIESIYYGQTQNKLATNKTTYNDCIHWDISDKYNKYLYSLTDEESKYYYKNVKDKRFEFQRKARSYDIGIKDEDIK